MLKTIVSAALPSNRHRKVFCVSAAVCVLISFTGCGLSKAPSESNPIGIPPIGTSSTGVLSGVVHGGNLPIYNATVSLYAAGIMGYGSSGGAALATTTTATNGTFQFTKNANGTTNSGASWSCPSSDPNPDPQIYIISVGGNTQGTGATSPNNTAAALMVALGPCSTITTNTSVQINELTTVATVFALTPYINAGQTPGSETIGTDGANSATATPQAAVGLNNSVSTIANLASISNGNVVTSNSYTGTNASVTGVTVTATPETSKIITIANILASCINQSTSTSATNCTDLFNSAVAPASVSTTSGSTPTFNVAQDTIQAAYYMAINPAATGSVTCNANGGTSTKRLQCLYDLAGGTGAPFQTGLGSAPSDWTIGVSFTAAGTCTGGTAGNFINGPVAVAVDASGNLWFSNGVSSNATFAGMSPAGLPLACVGNGATASPGGIAVDPSGNIWASFSGSSTGQLSVEELPASQIATATQSVLWEPPYSAYALTVDGNGNVFFSSGNKGTQNAGGLIYELPNPGATVYTAPGSSYSSAAIFPATPVASGLAAGNTTGSLTVDYLAVDHGGDIFALNSATTATETINSLVPTSLAISSYSIAASNAVTFYTTASPSGLSSGQNIVVTGLATSQGLLIDHQGFTISAVSTSAPYSVTATLIASPLTNNTSSPKSPSLTVTSQTSDTGTLTGYSLGSYSPTNSGHAFRGVAVDSDGYIYTGSQCCSTNDRELFKITPNLTTFSSSTGTYSANYIGGDNGTHAVALDGADNIWFGGLYPSSTLVPSGQTSYFVGEASSAGNGTTATFTGISPNGASPTVCTSGTSNGGPGCPAGGGYIKSSLLVPYDLAIDPSGNVWVPNTASWVGTTLTVNGTSITEIVGAAVPTVTPKSVAAGLGTLALKPMAQTGQTITFPQIGSLSYSSTPTTLAATSSSGLPVSLFVVSGPATASGTSLTMLGFGSVTVTANQAGNPDYTAATPVQQTFTITNPNPQQAPNTFTAATMTVAATSVGTDSAGFAGLSYEKNALTERTFTGTSNNMIALFKLLGTSVLRIGGASADEEVWTPNGAGGVPGQIAPSDVDALAAFLGKTGWKCLYAINLGGDTVTGTKGPNGTGSPTYPTTSALAAAEVNYVVGALGSSLLGIEIGNEPDAYFSTFFNGDTGWTSNVGNTEATYQNLWTNYRNAIVSLSPGVPITGPATSYSVSRLSNWTIPFGQNVNGEITQLTEHYYRGLASSNPTTANLVAPDATLTGSGGVLPTLKAGALVPYRISEANSYAGGGAVGVSNAYASTLWSIDFLFDIAMGGAQGVNFHGGGDAGQSYTPISDNNSGSVDGVRPLYYGLLLFDLAGQGTLYQTTLSGNDPLVTAYAVHTASGGLNVIIDNKDTSNLQVAITLPATYNLGSLQVLTQGSGTPSLGATSGVTIQGASVSTSGSFNPGTSYYTSPSGNQITIYVPALSAVLLKLQ